MSKPAARITDPVAHPLPPVLTGGPGSPTVLIGGLPAWRGIPAAGAAVILSAKKVSDAAITAAEAATVAAAGTPGLPAAKAAEETTKTTAAASMSSTITSSAGGADIHNCATPLPLPPHGPGVVIDGSSTVLINGLPACRMGDTIVEALGPPNKITMGCSTVLIGG
ncbi:PAAR domain-containing protein [Aerosakkonemataceae cyanobacterium BLCC-F50]|uniref:PAAR domain-containing protein n=1 Tax=Floridaenema flaviceps BLCC-F50 TaxID=3153642 RepID=A0ABV4XMF0_9CYAN